MEKINFFRRRQFVLGSKHLQIEGWGKYTIADRYYLTIHPDLSFQHVKTEGKSLTVLGYFIDPFQAEISNIDILNKILQDMNNITDITDGFEKASGRFIVIATIQDCAWLFNDAVGLRQVVYCKDKNDKIWCASQAEALAEHLYFLPDMYAMDYRNSHMFISGKEEFWFANDRTPYEEIKQLLPNHYLDLTTAKTTRFFPTTSCIKPLTLQNGIDLSVPLLKNSIKMAYNRLNLKMAISAGIDSRKSFAATKELKEKMFYFTQSAKNNQMDVRVTARLLSKLGISHNILDLKSMSDEFRQYYFISATCARETKGDIAYTLYYHFGPNATILNSNVSEITQCNYWLPKSNINGEGLAIITGLYHPLTINDFEKWLQDARPVCESTGLNILTLFHWEQRGGRWAAASFSEYDIAHDSFTPYNNRYLIKLILGINEKYRRNRMQNVALKTIASMWPEVLSEPINPSNTFSGRLHDFIRYTILHKYITPWFPVYEYAKFLWKRRQAYMDKTTGTMQK